MDLSQQQAQIAEKLMAVTASIQEAAVAAGRDPSTVSLVAATKTQTSDTIKAAIAAGVQICGENRVQELMAHLEDNAYEGAEVHFIGHLQTNKVKFVVGRVSLIHSVSSTKLLEAINAQAVKLQLRQDILLEVKLADEESKDGFSPAEVPAAAALAASLPGVRLRGLMCIPPPSEFPGENCGYFRKLREISFDIRDNLEDNSSAPTILSMGMSGDYLDAIAEGATHVRLGTALFGPRPPMHSNT